MASMAAKDSALEIFSEYKLVRIQTACIGESKTLA